MLPPLPICQLPLGRADREGKVALHGERVAVITVYLSRRGGYVTPDTFLGTTEEESIGYGTFGIEWVTTIADYNTAERPDGLTTLQRGLTVSLTVGGCGENCL